MNESQVEKFVCIERPFGFFHPDFYFFLRLEEAKLLYFLLLNNCVSTLYFDTDNVICVGTAKRVKKEHKE